MKKLFSLILLGFTLVTFAQNAPTNKGDKSHMTPEQQAITQTKHMALALDLTEKQQTQVLALNKKMNVERDPLRTKYRGPQQNDLPMTGDEKFEMKNKMLDAQLKHQIEMKKILNEKQYEDWKDMQQKNRKKHGWHRNKRPAPQNNE